MGSVVCAICVIQIRFFLNFYTATPLGSVLRCVWRGLCVGSRCAVRVASLLCVQMLSECVFGRDCAVLLCGVCVCA